RAGAVSVVDDDRRIDRDQAIPAGPRPQPLTDLLVSSDLRQVAQPPLLIQHRQPRHLLRAPGQINTHVVHAVPYGRRHSHVSTLGALTRPRLRPPAARPLPVRWRQGQPMPQARAVILAGSYGEAGASSGTARGTDCPVPYGLRG